MLFLEKKTPRPLSNWVFVLDRDRVIAPWRAIAGLVGGITGLIGGMVWLPARWKVSGG
jgi:hypothetical protein